MAVDPIESRSVFGPSWDAYDAYYNQETPAKQVKKSVGVPPHSLYDTMQPITGPQPGHVDLSTAKSVGGIGNSPIAPPPAPDAPPISGPGNDRKILMEIFSATSQRKDSHEAIEQDALEAIFKNKEMIKVLQREIAKEKQKMNNASFISRVMGWVSWAVSGAFAVSIFAALGFALFNPAAALAVGPAIGGIATIVLAALQGISSLTKAFFDYKRGKHEQEIEQKKFELTKRQKALKSKMGQINTEEQQKSSEFSRQTDLQKSYFQAGRIFGGS